MSLSLGIGLGLTTQRGGGGGEAFLPSDISGLIRWYDASDADTIVPYLVSGKVARWDDKSASGVNLVQTSASTRPTYDAANTVANGNPAVDWVSTTNSFRLDFPSEMTNAAYMLMIVAYGDGTDAVFADFNGLFSSNASNRRVMGADGTALMYNGTNRIFNGSFTNDSAYSTTALPMPLSAQSWDSTKIISSWAMDRIGSAYSANRGWYGPICEIVIYDAIPSGGDIQSLKNGLYTKWGITP